MPWGSDVVHLKNPSVSNSPYWDHFDTRELIWRNISPPDLCCESLLVKQNKNKHNTGLDTGYDTEQLIFNIDENIAYIMWNLSHFSTKTGFYVLRTYSMHHRGSLHAFLYLPNPRLLQTGDSRRKSGNPSDSVSCNRTNCSLCRQVGQILHMTSEMFWVQDVLSVWKKGEEHNKFNVATLCSYTLKKS